MNKQLLVKFGQRVRDERLKRDLSQEKLAALAKVHRTYIGMIERAEKKRLEQLFEGTGRRVDAWMNTGDQMFTFIEKAMNRFSHGTLEDRRSILAALGSNLLIKDKKLSIDIENCLFPIQKISGPVKAIKERLEPINTFEKQGQFEQMCSNNPLVLGYMDSNHD